MTGRRLVRLVALLVVPWLLLVARAEALTVALLEPPDEEPSFRAALFRLQGELLSVGLDVAIVARPAFEQGAETTRPGLEALARERQFDAIIDVVGRGSPSAVDVWVFRAPNQGSEVQRVALEADVSTPAETLAIRAIEVLRARFVEFDLALREREAQTLTEPAKAEPEPEPEPDSPVVTAGLAAGAVALIGLDRVGPQLMPLARFEWAPGWPLTLQATVAGFGSEPTIETQAGTVRVAQQYVVIGLSCCHLVEHGFQPLLGLSGGALRTSLDGRGVLQNEGHRVSEWSALLEGSFGLRLPLTETYQLTIASHVQFAEPEVAVHVLDSVVATTGRPNVLLSLTLGAWL